MQISSTQVTRLRYTPRKFVIHPDHNTLIVAEADHAAVPAAERRATENGMETDGQQAEVLHFSLNTHHRSLACQDLTHIIPGNRARAIITTS